MDLDSINVFSMTFTLFIGRFTFGGEVDIGWGAAVMIWEDPPWDDVVKLGWGNGS